MADFLTKAAGVLSALCLISVSQQASAATIFDNSVNDLSLRFNPGTYQVGDEIILAGSERYLTDFSFEFWGTNTASPGNTSFAGSVMARVRFYINDGANFNGYATPGTMFYDSGLFAVTTPTPRSTFDFTAGSDFPSSGLFIPSDTITWSVEFSGLGVTDSVGVDLYNPAVVGSDYPDYWENQGVGWALRTNSLSATMDFAARFDAVIPEPSSITLSVLGGLGLFIVAGRLRKK